MSIKATPERNALNAKKRLCDDGESGGDRRTKMSETMYGNQLIICNYKKPQRKEKREQQHQQKTQQLHIEK